jgi:hypothetical protein
MRNWLRHQLTWNWDTDPHIIIGTIVLVVAYFFDF